jgi:tRNA pseudouridine55 synthase
VTARRPPRWHGLLPVYKKAGPTSHDIVDLARRALLERRIGHTGTLDPMAEGLLVLGVGLATRLQAHLLEWDKTYRGRIRLGWATTTYDREGEPIDPRGEVPELDRIALDELAAPYLGEVDQVPPPYSAKKVGGKKLYELARSGEAVEVAPKKVTVHALALERTEPDLITLEVRCSSGFYVRSLAHDLGQRLGCGAHLDGLQRVRIGPYTAEDAIPQDELAAATAEQIVQGSRWTPLEKVRLPYPEVSLNPAATERFTHGQMVVVFRSGDEPLSTGALVSARSLSGHLLGVGSVVNVLARGRTVSVQPTMVLEPAR